MSPGTTKAISWRFNCLNQCDKIEIGFKVQGLIQGSVPKTDWDSNTLFYSPYSYIDIVGTVKGTKLKI